MTSFDTLRQKWFIDVESPGSEFVPRTRHPGSNLAPFRAVNTVTPVVDGAAVMQLFHDNVEACIAHATPEQCEVYVAAWLLEDVLTLGQSETSSGALDLLERAKAAGVKTYLMVSSHLTHEETNAGSVARLHSETATLDGRFPVAGSCHQKLLLFRRPDDVKAIVGSVDLYNGRWDTEAHAPNDPERPGGPTHDLAMLVEGSAVQDLQISFLDRWNDESRDGALGGLGYITDDVVVRGGLPTRRREYATPLQTSTILGGSGSGTHGVQVLQTYGRSAVDGYSWSDEGEFTVWASYLNAIRTAEQYIYIEEQYFFPFGYNSDYGGPVFEWRNEQIRRSDIVHQLGEAMGRGVNVVVLTSEKSEDSHKQYQKYQRDLGVRYLEGISAVEPGDFTVATLSNGSDAIYVHSKLLIADDEFVLVGNANINQRSMTHDGELHLGIVDTDDAFAKDLRKQLWAEHLELALGDVDSQLDDPTAGYEKFVGAVAASEGRVRPLEVPDPGEPPNFHETTLQSLIDPYAGPARNALEKLTP